MNKILRFSLLADPTQCCVTKKRGVNIQGMKKSFNMQLIFIDCFGIFHCQLFIRLRRNDFIENIDM